MPRIAHIYYAPVKSLALTPLARTHVDKAGIPGDRAFVIVDAQGDAVTQRECFALVQVRAVYEPVDDHLTVTLPDGTVAAGVPEPGASAPITGFWDQAVPAVEARGPWDDALSAFAGRPLRLVRPAPGRAFDGYPLSICSLESLDALAAAAGEERVDGRRFRQNIYIAGASAAHQEDAWLGRQVRAGTALLNVRRPDGRCVVTTRDPDTGEHDLDTLKVIASYRGVRDGSVNFGVYCTVAQPGEIAVGDEVAPV